MGKYGPKCTRGRLTEDLPAGSPVNEPMINEPVIRSERFTLISAKREVCFS